MRCERYFVGRVRPALYGPCCARSGPAVIGHQQGSLGRWIPRVATARESEGARRVCELLSAALPQTAYRDAGTLAAAEGLAVTPVEWWLSDSRWYEPRSERPPRLGWCVSPLVAPNEVLGWLVPQARAFALVLLGNNRVPRTRDAIAATPAASAPRAGTGTGGGFAQLFGTHGRGVPDRELDRFAALVAFLAAGDAEEMACRHQVPEAKNYGFKAQGVRLLTAYNEAGFAFEVYPEKQRQRSELRALVVLGNKPAEVYVAAVGPSTTSP